MAQRAKVRTKKDAVVPLRLSLRAHWHATLCAEGEYARPGALWVLWCAGEGDSLAATMAPFEQPPWADPIPIALLRPSQQITGRSIKGIVTLIWPYSTSQRSFSLLLVEPDFRLRRQNGQVRVHLTGSSARTLAKSGVRSGDCIQLSLEGVAWARDESRYKTRGRGIEWELQFGERLLLQVLKHF